MKKISIIILALVLVTNFSITQISAAALSTVTDAMSNQKKSEASNHNIQFITPSGVAAGGTITVIFPSDFVTTGVDYTDIDLIDDSTDLTLAALPSGSTWGVAFGGTDNRTLTITSGNGIIVGGSVVQIKIGTNATHDATGDHQITNATSSGNKVINITCSSGDSGQVAVYVLNEGTITTSGTVDPTISMSISATTIGFGHFADTNIRYASADSNGSALEPVADNPTKIAVNTNAASGLTIAVRDQGSGINGGLWAAAPISELISAAASSAVLNNSKKFGIYGKNASGVTIAEGFNNNSSGDLAVSLTDQTFASTASSVDNGSLDLTAVAAINGSTKAGNYIDYIIVTCTGNF